MNDDTQGGAGGGEPVPRLDAEQLDQLARQASETLRAAGVDTVLVVVHCHGGIAPWRLSYRYVNQLQLLVVFGELCKWLIGQLCGAALTQSFASAAPPATSEPTGPLS